MSRNQHLRIPIPTQAPIYLDYAATTPVDPRVVDEMLPYFTEVFGNPGSPNECGLRASDAVELARERVAAVIGGDPKRVIFTAGASEANNLAFFGLACKKANGHFVTTNIEHKSVLEPLIRLKKQGYGLTIVPVGSGGVVSASDIEAAIEPDTICVSVMRVNNEIGTIQPTDEIYGICREHDVLFHTDATQAFGKMRVDANRLDMLSISSHKIYGPKGVGALYRSDKVPLGCMIHGGGQESGLRAGTLNVPGIVGLGAAAELARTESSQDWARTNALSQRLLTGLRSAIVLVQNGEPGLRVPWISSLAFPGADATALCRDLGICMGRGSACSKLSDTSHVLRAIGLPEKLCGATVRISLGRFTTEDQIDWAVGRIAKAMPWRTA